MPDFTHDAPGLDRRQLLVGSAIAVPAIMLTTAVPARATSADSTLTVDITGATVTAGGSTPVTATVLNSQGLGWAGQTVTLNLTGPSGATLGSTTGVTNSAGQFTTTLDVNAFTQDDATITVTATSGPLTDTDTTIVDGGVTLELATTAAISGSQPGGINAGRANTVTATLKNAGGTGIPGQTISLAVAGITGTYSAVTATTDASGIATVTLTPDTWTTPGTTATLTATATNGPGTVTAQATPLTLGANAVAAGYNSAGQLGDGTTNGRTSLTQPLQVFPSPITQIVSGGLYAGSPGFFTHFLLEDGTVWSVGRNETGQLGLGDTTDRSVPTQIPGLADIAQIAAGDNNGLARSEGGAVWSWGSGLYGSNGDGSTSTRLSPVQVSGLTAGVDEIAAHSNGGYALLDGAVYAWGQNNVGQLGDTSTVARTSPVSVFGLSSGVAHIAAGDESAYAVISGTGEVRAWGGNSVGQLGNNSTSGSNVPVTVSGLSGVTHLAAAYRTVYALSGSGVKAWGANQVILPAGIDMRGMVGNNDVSTPALTPVTPQGLGSGVASIAASGITAFARLTDGTIMSWGENYAGGFGNGTSGYSHVPTPAATTLPAGRTIAALENYSPTSVATFFITAP